MATVIDLASRKVVGWAMADHMEASLVCEAMQTALRGRRPGPGLMFHSDRGSQTGLNQSSHQFSQLLQKHDITQSLSHPAQCWDNSVAEAWFGTYKLELIEGRTWRGIAELRAETLLWIEGWYNLRRLHSSLHYLSPVESEHQSPATQPLSKRPNQTVRKTAVIPVPIGYRASSGTSSASDRG